MRIVFFILLALMMNSLFAQTQITDVNTKKQDEYYMHLAIQLAKHNPKQPFAAVIIDNKTGKILAEGLNASQTNPTYHGEMVAINNCAKKYPHLDWSTVTLYTTAEPCPMCQSASAWAGVSRVVYATSQKYLKAHGWNAINITAAEVNQRADFYKGQITGGVLTQESNSLFNPS